MRFWITKNSELPVREQLLRQVVLGILSEDLPAGYKLPSVRALARRHHIHANTVSAAYHDLVQQGWLEMRHGSGIYVGRPGAVSDKQSALSHLLTELLQSARALGYEQEEVLRSLEQRVRPRTYRRLLLIEPEPAMREILRFELSRHLRAPIELAESTEGLGASNTAETLVVALPTRAAKFERQLPEGVLLLPLRLRAAATSFAGRKKPASNTVVALALRSKTLEGWARAMLIAVGIEPDALYTVNVAAPGWQERLGGDPLVVADMLTASEVRDRCRVEVLQVISDSCLAELEKLFGASPCGTLGN